MDYCVRINGRIIEASLARNEVERRAQVTWLKAQAQGLRVEVAEAGTQNFKPLDQFLSSAPPAGSGSNPHPPQTPIGGGSGNAHLPASTQRLPPTSFNNPSSALNSASPAPATQSPSFLAPPAQMQVFSPPAPAPLSYQIPAGYPAQTFNAPSGMWQVVSETSRLDPALHSYIRPEHQWHGGSWLVRNYDLVPIAGFWICNAARTIDSALIIVTFGIYLIFLFMAIVQGRQTLGQKLAGVRMVRQDDLAQASVGQFVGSMICYVILSLIPVVSLLVFVQAFTEKKQGLNHLLCGVMHIEEQHYDAGRGCWMTLLAMVAIWVFYLIILFLFALLNQS